ncbi:transcriptional regulator, TetR family [Maridesulfovibrio ferrireducens]|uniref:Transcriptional regulator, TetR family n=1 Tax=Maridesulfovibrio ferrireducens TaxID=246191 RepID=A0A1G9BS61_9BACT|nr:TetR/AcrR family transcriptional regulator [Maridesulfovibrio ferrireducens]SDK42213.1 transcriptional regulator, TetR family [Maridesulfovibrio ferrireducens]
MPFKLVPINTLTATRKKILHATYKCLAQTGFNNLTADEIALRSGISRKVIFHYYKGIENILSDLAESSFYWPSTEELLANTPDEFPDICPEKQVGAFFLSLRKELEERPETLRILAWEMLERSALSEELEDVRVRTALEFFEHLGPDVPDEVDLAAAVALLGGGISYLAIRSLNTKTYGGVSLQDEIGWERLEHAMHCMLKGLLFP